MKRDLCIFFAHENDSHNAPINIQRTGTEHTREHVALVLSAPPPIAGCSRKKLNRFVLCPSGDVQSGLKHCSRTHAMLAPLSYAS
jgi:hypothetical protein